MNSDLLKLKEAIAEQKHGQQLGRGAEMEFDFFRERRTSFSLDFWEIRPSAIDRARREVVLRGAGYA